MVELGDLIVALTRCVCVLHLGDLYDAPNALFKAIKPSNASGDSAIVANTLGMKPIFCLTPSNDAFEPGGALSKVCRLNAFILSSPSSCMFCEMPSWTD